MEERGYLQLALAAFRSEHACEQFLRNPGRLIMNLPRPEKAEDLCALVAGLALAGFGDKFFVEVDSPVKFKALLLQRQEWENEGWAIAEQMKNAATLSKDGRVVNVFFAHHPSALRGVGPDERTVFVSTNRTDDFKSLVLQPLLQYRHDVPVKVIMIE